MFFSVHWLFLAFGFICILSWDHAWWICWWQALRVVFGDSPWFRCGINWSHLKTTFRTEMINVRERGVAKNHFFIWFWTQNVFFSLRVIWVRKKRSMLILWVRLICSKIGLKPSVFLEQVLQVGMNKQPIANRSGWQWSTRLQQKDIKFHNMDVHRNDHIHRHWLTNRCNTRSLCR